MEWGLCCLKCGKTPKDGIVIHVDHIKPRSVYPKLALKLSNLQPLCEKCNKAKGATIADYRPKMGKIKVTIRLLLAISFVALIVTNQAIMIHAAPYLAEYLGLMTAETCEAQVVP